MDTLETDISALNLSPRSKAKMKLRKLIKMTFKMTGKAPNSTADFYRIGKVLGRGAFGKVNLAIHRLSDEMVAIKSIDLAANGSSPSQVSPGKEKIKIDELRESKVMKEVKILKKIRHKNIIQLYDTFETSNHIIFVMELC